MSQRAHTVCFTGHRELREPDHVLEQRLLEILTPLIEYGCTDFCAGGARGFDTLAARVVLSLKERYPHIRLVLILPFPDQYLKEGSWTEEEVREFLSLRQKADEVLCLQAQWTPGCYYRRNRELVDRSSLCISYQSRTAGGTAYTVDYAERQGLPVTNCCIF